MRDRRVLVTGAAGFMGRHLAERLAHEGAEVVAVDVRPSFAPGPATGIRYAVADVRDSAAMRALLEGVDLVFHLASLHLEVHAEEAEFRRVNVAAAGEMVDLCSAAGVRRLIHTSSVGVYGHVADPPAAEDAPKRPQSPYERTKLEGERAVAARARETGLDVIVLRPAWVYGPGCPRTAKLLRSIANKRFFYVGSGLNLRHPVHIADMLDAYALAAESRAGPSVGVYNVAGPRWMTLRELVETSARVLGVAPPRVSVPRPLGWAAGAVAELIFRPLRRNPPFSRRSLAFFENDNAFSIEAARDHLGFDPAVDLEEGLRRYLAESGGA